MAEKTSFNSTVESLLKGMDGFLTTKTVVGEPIHAGENILLPLADVSFGVGAGAFGENAKQKASGGMFSKITPSAILVINGNGIRMVSVKSQDAVSKVLDMVPDLINRFTNKGGDDVTLDDVEEMIHEAEDSEA
ncbi:MAG: GerW family sporulation protein [Lachnospiraceae bacterium]|nr:GerW family sporulation protein [Lachnospiraceae bacterium]